MIDRLRLFLKLILRHFLLLDSFCRHCGRKVHDYSAPDDIWAEIEPHIKRGKTLCYDCFCVQCAALDLPSVWRIELL